MEITKIWSFWLFSDTNSSMFDFNMNLHIAHDSDIQNRWRNIHLLSTPSIHPMSSRNF